MAKRSQFLCSVVVALSLCVAGEAWARAGGGRSHGSSGILGLILWPFIVAYGAYRLHVARRKASEAKAFIEQFAALDPSWNVDDLRERIRQVFMAIQRGWASRDQSICKDDMSDALYRLHQSQIDDLIARKRQNILEDISLSDILIVQAVDSADDSKDYFWAFLEGSMADYEIDTDTRERTDGDKDSVKFRELWKFVRRADHAWVADSIDADVSVHAIKAMKSRFADDVAVLPASRKAA